MSLCFAAKERVAAVVVLMVKSRRCAGVPDGRQRGAARRSAGRSQRAPPISTRRRAPTLCELGAWDVRRPLHATEPPLVRTPKPGRCQIWVHPQGLIYTYLHTGRSRTEQRRASLVLVMRPAHLHPHKKLALHPARRQEGVARSFEHQFACTTAT